jgi:hypothetical protein
MKKAGLLCCLSILVFSLSCGHPRAMTSMRITPDTATVNGLGLIVPVQYRAYGTFIHPAETVEISQQVEWSTDIPQVATVANGANGGLVTPAGSACGSTNVTATAGRNLVGNGGSGSVMTATAVFKVTDPNITGCD